MTTIIVIGTLIFGGIIYYAISSNNKSNENDMFITTQGQSSDRIKNLGLDEPTEDVSHILEKVKLNYPQGRLAKKEEYKANPKREWIIDLIPINGENFNKEDFDEMFDYEWRSNFRSTIFGFSPEENRWTYANAGGTPDIYSKLQVAVDVQRVYNDGQDYSPEKLGRYLFELEKRIKDYPTPLKIETSESIEDAILKAKKLVSLYQEFNFDAIIILQAKNKFKGMEFWDALLSVGLKWGNMDLFHWNNYESDFGNDQHFSVWTSTNPGFFFPEEIKNGNMNPENLIFGFSVPRSADPINIQKVMIEVVKYCKKRLGGEILDSNGNKFNEEKETLHMIEFVNKMKGKGLIPGSEDALRMF